MNWYTGPIGNAISESLTKKLIFLVYAYDCSSQMDEMWNDETISEKCNANCISIKLDASSDECNQFKQLYPITLFPTTYLIGNVGGAPIRIISGIVEKEELISRLENAIEVHNVQKQSAAGNVQPEQSQADAPASPSTSNPDQSTHSPDQKKKDLDERVALAKEKLRLIQEKKRAEDEEKQRQQEIERRKMGQEILKQKQLKEEQELKKLADQKRKEKLEDELAKKRVMERIQQDREAKQAKYASEKADAEKAKEAARTKQELAKQQERQAEAARRGNSARIQFRLVDGSQLVNIFEPEQTLADARAFITEKLKGLNQSTSFSMHSSFPKRDYTAQDMSVSLRDLQLVPSATLLIIPIKSTASKTFGTLLPSKASASNSPGSSSSLMSYGADLLGFVFLPFTIIWGIVSNLLGMGPPANSANRNLSTPGTSGQRSGPNNDQNLRRRNIGGLRDGDEDNATYNGNSTQQM